MASYTVRHLVTGEDYTRDAILFNIGDQDCTSDLSSHATIDPAIEDFHKRLPDYAETKLHALPAVAKELGVKDVFLKDEGMRFGLPAFKILGASWAIFRALCKELGLPLSSSLENVKTAVIHRASEQSLRIVTCTEGNWGRACARMGKILDVPVTVYVPDFMSQYTERLIEGEGANVIRLNPGSYDDAIATARRDSEDTAALLIMDTSWDGYEEVPRWVTEGYTTMLTETDRQLAAAQGSGSDGKATMYIASVGVGSWAHSVVEYYKPQHSFFPLIITVEPDTAASFKESLHCGQITPIETGHTIMAGMCCGTTSKVAWPVLKQGVNAAVTVSDQEAHQSILDLNAMGVKPGPCGAATLAALRRLMAMNDGKLASRDTTVVLFSTEGEREYTIPT